MLFISCSFEHGREDCPLSRKEFSRKTHFLGHRRGLTEAREPQKRVQASQSVLPSPEQVLEATGKERRTPEVLGARTMRKDRLAFSHGRSGSLAACSYFCDDSAWKASSAWAAILVAYFVVPEKAKDSANPKSVRVPFQTLEFQVFGSVRGLHSKSCRAPAPKLVSVVQFQGGSVISVRPSAAFPSTPPGCGRAWLPARVLHFSSHQYRAGPLRRSGRPRFHFELLKVASPLFLMSSVVRGWTH